MSKGRILKKKHRRELAQQMAVQTAEMQEMLARQGEQMLLLAGQVRDQQDILKKYYGEYQQLKKRQEIRHLMTHIRMRESMLKDMEFYRERGKMNTRGYSLLEMYVNEYTDLLEDAGVEILDFREHTAFDPEIQKPIERVQVGREELDRVVLRVFSGGYRWDGLVLKKADVSVGIYEA